MNLETIFEGGKAFNRKEVIAFLQKKGRVRLSEAGPDLRVYYFTPLSGEMFKIYLYNDGAVSFTEENREEKRQICR